MSIAIRRGRQASAIRDEPVVSGRDTAWLEVAMPRLYGYFLTRVGGHGGTAEDLTQETVLAAHRSGYRPRDPDAVLPWVYGIARHKLVDHYRRQARDHDRIVFHDDASIDALAAPPLPELDLDQLHIRDTVIAVLASLPVRQRAAIVLRYLDGLDVPATAALLDVSVHAAESLLARGRVAFRTRYRELTGDDR